MTDTPNNEGLLRHFGQALDLVGRSVAAKTQANLNDIEATIKERQAKDDAETAAHDREDDQAKEIATLDDARRRIADLTEARDDYREQLRCASQALELVGAHIRKTLYSHQEKPND